MTTYHQAIMAIQRHVERNQTENARTTDDAEAACLEDYRDAAIADIDQSDPIWLVALLLRETMFVRWAPDVDVRWPQSTTDVLAAARTAGVIGKDRRVGGLTLAPDCIRCEERQSLHCLRHAYVAMTEYSSATKSISGPNDRPDPRMS